MDILEEQRPQAKPNLEIIRLTDEILNLEGEFLVVQKTFSEQKIVQNNYSDRL